MASTNPEVKGGDFIGIDSKRQMKGSPKITQPNELVFNQELRTKLWKITEQTTSSKF